MKNSASPAWIKGPIVLAGNWEPLIFRRRKNALGTDGAGLYLKEHSPELVERLVEAGVNLLITHYFKGCGLEAEREDIEMAHRLINYCHQRDIKVGGYIGDTFFFETMLLEEPEAGGWAERRENGSVVPYAGEQMYRWKWCRNNPAFFDYMRRVLKMGIENGLDLIHFDNFLNKPEPLTCRCPFCEEAFRKFLYKKYSTAELKERLGFSNLTMLRPPVFSEPLYVTWHDDVIQDPLLQEWIDFRCHSLAGIYRRLSEFCRQLNQEVAIECNPTGIWGENTAYMRSVDHARLLPYGHFFWDESPNPHGLLDNGAISTGIRSMKMGEALGNRKFHYCFHGSETASRIRMGESLAYNGGCLGMVGFLHGDKILSAEKCKPFVDFLRKNPELFVNTRSIARVGVYRSFASLAYNSWEPHLQAILAEQALLQSHIPFDLLFNLDSLRETVIVPGAECLSDGEIGSLVEHARNGGAVVLAGDCGIYDEWRRPRPENPSRVFFKDNCDAAAVGKGSIAWTAALELPPEAPNKDGRRVWDDFYKVVDGRFWFLPSNAGALLRALKGTKGGGGFSPIRTDSPITTFIEPRLLADRKRLVLHIVNYDPTILGEQIEISLPGRKIRGAKVLSPLRAAENAKVHALSDGTRITFKNNEIYSLVLVEPTDDGIVPDM